jgi:hypothetical protein
VGGLVVRNNDANKAPRKKLTLRATPAGYTGKVTLQYAGDKVKFYDAANGGNQIPIDGAANKFNAADLPKSVFVEGAAASDAMRDVEISVQAGGDAAAADTAKITVLWVDKPAVRFAGDVSANNSKRDNYKGWTKAGHYALGLQDFVWLGAPERIGFGSEGKAKVYPTKFDYPDNNLKLERDYDFKDYKGGAPDVGAASVSIPPGNDTGDAHWRDDDPTADDYLYDVDAAGLSVPDEAKDTIYRTRNNFRTFASITVEGKAVRCSETLDYFIRFSQKQTKAPAGHEWKVIDPPDVAGDNNAGDGKTKLSANLK